MSDFIIEETSHSKNETLLVHLSGYQFKTIELDHIENLRAELKIFKFNLFAKGTNLK